MNLIKICVIATSLAISATAIAMPPLTQAEKDKQAAEAAARHSNVPGKSAMELAKEKEKKAAEQKAAEQAALDARKTGKQEQKQVQAVGRDGPGIGRSTAPTGTGLPDNYNPATGGRR